MRIIHKIVKSVNANERKAFQSAGIELQSVGGLPNLIIFEIANDDPRWKNVEPLVKEFHASDMMHTTFSEKELGSARFLEMGASWHHGYPQPEEGFGYLKATYDLTEFCVACGIGAKQNAPFRMKKTPNWGRRSILQLNWVFDEYFVKPDIWKSVFKPFEIGCKPVLLDKTEAEMESVVQLENPITVDLQMGDRPYGFDECSKCGRRKYLPGITGFFPAPAATNAALFRSSQYFGSGASAHNAVLVSSTLYRTIKDAEVKGVEFQPCVNLDDPAQERIDLPALSPNVSVPDRKHTH